MAKSSSDQSGTSFQGTYVRCSITGRLEENISITKTELIRNIEVLEYERMKSSNGPGNTTA